MLADRMRQINHTALGRPYLLHSSFATARSLVGVTVIGGFAYAIAYDSLSTYSVLYKYNLDTKALVGSVTLPAQYAASIANDGTYIYIASQQGRLVIYATNLILQAHTLIGTGTPQAVIAIGGYLWVSYIVSGEIKKLTTGGSVLATVSGITAYNFSKDANSLFAFSLGGAAKINLTTLSVIRASAIFDGFIAADGEGGAFALASSTPRVVYKLDSNLAIVSSVTLSYDISSIVFDQTSKTLYVCGVRSANTITLLDANLGLIATLTASSSQAYSWHVATDRVLYADFIYQQNSTIYQLT